MRICCNTSNCCIIITFLSQTLILTSHPEDHLPAHPGLNPHTHPHHAPPPPPPLIIPAHIPFIASGPWKAPGTFSELLSTLYRHRALSIFPPSRRPKPAIRSHAMCSLSSRGAQLFAGGTHAGARVNDWHSGDLPGWQPTTGMEGCFRTGCHGLLLCHSSAVEACCLRGRRQQKYFHTSKGQLGLVFIKRLRAIPQSAAVVLWRWGWLRL